MTHERFVLNGIVCVTSFNAIEEKLDFAAWPQSSNSSSNVCQNIVKKQTSNLRNFRQSDWRNILDLIKSLIYNILYHTPIKPCLVIRH